VVQLDASGKCRQARLCVGSVSWKPIIPDLSALAGQALTEDAVRAAVQPVRSAAQPMADVRGSAAYKREMAVEFAVRAVMTAGKRAQKNR